LARKCDRARKRSDGKWNAGIHQDLAGAEDCLREAAVEPKSKLEYLALLDCEKALASAAEGREDALKNNASQEGPCACAGRKWNTPKKNADKKGHGW